MHNKILLVNGPNLNLLGKRQVNIYGTQSLDDIIINLKKCLPSEYQLVPFQNNSEGEIVNFLNAEYLNAIENSINIYSANLSLREARGATCTKSEAGTRTTQQQTANSNALNIAGIIINPAAYTHTSIAIRDALEVFHEMKVKIFEVHLSNIFRREEFRHKSYISAIADGVISGFGAFGYEVALQRILQNE